MTGIELIAAERKRQIEEEGWSLEHDDQHTTGALVAAAIAYAALETMYVYRSVGDDHVFVDATSRLPFFREVEETRYSDDSSRYRIYSEKKQYSRIQSLIVAGAFIAAEIDRLQRVDEQQETATA